MPTVAALLYTFVQNLLALYVKSASSKCFMFDLLRIYILVVVHSIHNLFGQVQYLMKVIANICYDKLGYTIGFVTLCFRIVF